MSCWTSELSNRSGGKKRRVLFSKAKTLLPVSHSSVCDAVSPGLHSYYNLLHRVLHVPVSIEAHLCVRYLTLGHALVPERLVFPHMDHNTLIYKQIRLSRSLLLSTPLQFPIPALITCSFLSYCQDWMNFFVFRFFLLPLHLSSLYLSLRSLLLLTRAKGKNGLTLMGSSAVRRVKRFVLT